MSSLIANQVKKMCFISVKFFNLFTTFVSLFTLNWYNINYNNNCLFNATIRYSTHNRKSLLELHTQLVTSCFNYNWLTDLHSYIIMYINLSIMTFSTWWNIGFEFLDEIQGPLNTIFFFGKFFKKTTEYFLKFLLLFESRNIR